MTDTIKGPLALIILDGWGHREPSEFNAITLANKPHFDALWNEYPHTLISGSGKCVGLPDGQMGNSEVGHLNMGAGRIMRQDLTRIDDAIEDKSFFTNPILKEAFELANKTNKSVHLLGLLSPGGVHSHERHFHATIEMAAKENIQSLFIHAFLDGRDTPPKSVLPSIKKIESLCKELNCGKMSSLIGRYYAMDRDNRWDRIQQAYDLLVDGKADHVANNAEEVLQIAYNAGETDEFIKPSSIHAENKKADTIQDGDIVIFINFRADRAREITQALTDKSLTHFKRDPFPQLGKFVCFSEYDERFALPVAFESEPLTNLFADVISKHGLKQLRIAETEKYAHVTFFFNGGEEKAFPHEERILIPSPKVATYDLQPNMSAIDLTDQLINQIKNKRFDVIICNFANADMVGHTGNLNATVQAIEVIDNCLKKITSALKEVDGEMIITADHGNAEQMFDSKTQQPHTAHTSDPVPFIYIGRNAKIINEKGKLSDIAPTMLYLLNIEKPAEMSGTSLVKTH